MRTITLDRPWSYVTPEKTIDYPAGEHEVYSYIADQAEAEGVITPTGSRDPLDGSIEQMAEYLATVDDPARLTQLREAEVGGKTRKGALDAIDARMAELDGATD